MGINLSFAKVVIGNVVPKLNSVATNNIPKTLFIMMMLSGYMSVGYAKLGDSFSVTPHNYAATAHCHLASEYT